MVCTVCGRTTAIEYDVKSEGKALRLTLCRDCYERLYVAGDSPLPTFFGTVPDVDKACPDCGTRLKDFKATGMLGCAYCYTAFRNELKSAILYVQGNLIHDGKVPSADAEEKYERVRGLAFSQEKLLERIRAAERGGNAAEARMLKIQLQTVNRKLNGGDEE